MNYNIRFDRNFTIQYNALTNDYGEEFSKLNGFSPSQLSFTDFIDNFIDNNTVADASVDGNSNVGNKDMRTLMNEMPKPHRKLIAFNKIYYEMCKAWGKKDADEWLQAEWLKALYLHDADTSTYVHYCFNGNTKIITDQGLKKLSELTGQSIKVLNKHRVWEDARVEQFGKQELWKLVLKRNDGAKEVSVTGNHKWFTINPDTNQIYENTTSTTELKVGDRIPFNTSDACKTMTPTRYGIAHGYLSGFADDCVTINFDEDKSVLIPYFDVSLNGESYAVNGCPNSYLTLPALNESSNYLYSWLSGYFASCGRVTEDGNCIITFSRYDYIKTVQDILCVLGLPVSEITQSLDDAETKTYYSICLSPAYLCDEFFVRPSHLKAWKEYCSTSIGEEYWEVDSVENTHKEEEVYCAVVPNTESFTIEGNILTHNCFAYDLKDLAEKGLFFLDGFNAEPPQHLSTFVDFVKEYISFASNRSSGAVGLPNIIPYMYYFWDKDCKTGYATKSDEYYAKQQIQRFIYAVNQPYVRDGMQSAFTNVSVFDGEYLEALFGGAKFPDGSYMIDKLDEIKEFQKVFMKEVAEIRSHNMFTFPVLSISLLRKNGKFADEDFAIWGVKHNMKWNDSNLFIDDSVTSLSNCCRLKSNIDDLG